MRFWLVYSIHLTSLPLRSGPMISDLVHLDDILNEVNFDGQLGAPLKPFEQLMGCMPPSQARHLPKPYRKFMTDPDSPIIDFYPDSFTIDMNGKRWPWEAVTLLPFIDSKRLLEVAATIDENELTEGEKMRNSFGEALVFAHDSTHAETVEAIGDTEGFQQIDFCTVRALSSFASSAVFHPKETPVLEPQLVPGVKIPLPGYGCLRNAPVQSLWRRKVGLDVFSSRSRYMTSCLEISNVMPPIPPLEDLAPTLIGTSVYINYPYFLEGFVTAVSDETMTIRGQNKPKMWSPSEAAAWRNTRDGIARQLLTGEGVSGSGGLIIPDDQPVTISVRPFEKLVPTKDGQVAKSYASFEVDVPLIATFWEPSCADPRLELPSRLEKNPFDVTNVGLKNAGRLMVGGKRQTFPKRLLPPKNSPSINIQTANFSHDAIGSYSRRSYSVLAKMSPQKSGEFHPLKCNLGSRNVRTNYGKYPCLKTPSTRGGMLVASFVAASFLFGVAQSASPIDYQRYTSGKFLENPMIIPASSEKVKSSTYDESLFDLRAGHFDALAKQETAAPALEFAHGTTTLSFVFHGGIIAAVDSRASLGSFVGSKTTQKVLPVNSHILGTMAGGAADCMFWIRNLKSKALLHELAEGSRMTVARASRILSNALYENRGSDLSIGTMIMGYDEEGPPRVFYVDSTGKRIEGEMFAVGSGSTFALGILDTELRKDMTVDEAITLGIKAIRHATFRDAYSGGFINVFLITREGWRKVYTEDIARLSSGS